VCVTGGGAGCRGSDANRCLDDVRTVRTLRQLASNPVSAIPTYVIGLSGDNHPAFAPTLEAMAVAGGRPRVDPAGRRTFYDVRRPEELAAALTSIQGALSRCVFALPTRVPRGDGVTVTVGGAAVARDPSRAVGWDWTDRAAGELTLFGAACAPSGPRPAVTATVVCDVGP
jgi:hypothetical protein